MAVSYVTLYLPGSSTGSQVVEGSQLHRIYVAMGGNSVPSTPGQTVRQDPFPQYVDAEDLAAALAGVGGGGGAVASVNGQAGVVVLDADDIGDGTTKVTMTSAERDKLANITPAANIYTDEQARDAVGTAIVAGAGITKTVDAAANTITISATGAGGAAAIPSAVLLDDFAGADDDAKLTAALSYAAAQTYAPSILFKNRLYQFTTANRAPFDGMRLRGAPGWANPERATAATSPMRIQLSMTGLWFNHASGDMFTVSMYNLTFLGGSNATVAGGAGNWYSCNFRDIYASGLRSVLGTQAQPMVMTGCWLDGTWEINNSYNGAFHLAGSDCALWMNGMAIDSGTAFLTAGSSTGQYHIWFENMDKTVVGPLYMTAEAGWGGIRQTGPGPNSTSTNQGTVTYLGPRIEGRNPTAACDGALVRVEGGIARFVNPVFNYAMQDPAAMGHTPQDAGAIHHSGGQLVVTGANYDRAAGVAETVPFIYTDSAGKCIVKEALTPSRGGTWTGLPRVAKPTANVENRITDGTVTLVSV